MISITFPFKDTLLEDVPFLWCGFKSMFMIVMEMDLSDAPHSAVLTGTGSGRMSQDREPGNSQNRLVLRTKKARDPSPSIEHGWGSQVSQGKRTEETMENMYELF